MTNTNFKVEEEQVGDVSVIKLNGYLDAHTAPKLEHKLNELTSKGKYKILVDFKELTYISSAGLGVFMGSIEQCREHGGDIKMCQMQENVYTIFDLLGFPMLYDIANDMQTLIDKFND